MVARKLRSMDFEEIVRFLERSALFSDVTPEQIRAVAACAVIENHPAGSIIIEEDTPSDYFYLIVEGTVDIYREEKELLLESLSTGAVFGLLSIIENKPRSATVETQVLSTLIKLDLHQIASSLSQGKDIYNAIVINHINDLATIIRSTNSLAIQSMKTGMEEFKKRISVGNFFSSAILIVAAYSFFVRLALDYVKSLRTTTFVTSALLAVSAVIVVFMMKSTPYSWTDYGFTLKNWRSSLADTLLKTSIFIAALTVLKWILTLAELMPAPVFSFPFFRRHSFAFALGIAVTYSIFCILQEIILRSALQHSLIHFLTGRFAKTRIIATTTLIAAATHLHLKSLVFPLLIIIPNIFWCLLYDKHRSLLCVSVSHILIGVWALFVLGSPWQ
jgi:CRP-like cAMP-binding protein